MENFILVLAWFFGVGTFLMLLIAHISVINHNSNPIAVAINGEEKLSPKKVMKTFAVLFVSLAYLISHYFMG